MSDDILKKATEESKVLAKEIIVRLGDWIEKEVKAKSDLPDLLADTGASGATEELVHALNLARAAKASIEKKLEAKAEAEKLVKHILDSALKIITAAAVAGIGRFSGDKG